MTLTHLDPDATRKRAVASAAHLTGAYVNGQWRRPSGSLFELTHPFDGAVTGSLNASTADDVDDAVAAARTVFESGTWAQAHPRDRSEVLLAFAHLIDDHTEELAALETLDMGKPLRDALQVDIPKSAALIRWYAQAITSAYGHVAPTSHDVLAVIRRVPLGVVGCITPWNFPLYQAAYKLGPVLAAGNSLVIKPSELAPRSTLRVAELAVQAGLPPGVLNVVAGGPATGEALASHRGLDALAFTGSSDTATHVSRAASASLAKLSIEAGGKSAHVVLQTTVDLNRIATAVADGICYNAGQVCSAGSRLIVPDAMADDLLDRIATCMTKYHPGDPFDPETTLGPLVTEAAATRVRAAVADAVEAGATAMHPVENRTESTVPAHVTPVILDRVGPHSFVAQHELFGPVLAVLRYHDTDDPITIANDTPFGLGAAVWTDSLDDALTTAGRLRAGQVWVNNYDGSDFTVPWGGMKRSGSGRDKSLEALQEYTASSTVWIQTTQEQR